MPNNEPSPEARKALKLAEELFAESHRRIHRIAAALLEARANGMQTVVDGTKGGNYWSVEAQRLRAEALQLRGKG